MAERATDLETVERAAYAAAYSDGTIDLFAGVSLLWIGAAWIWLQDLAGVAGVFPAIFIAPMAAIRTRIVEPRIGYVKWSAPRRTWERRNLAIALLAGVAVFLIGVGVFVIVNRGAIDSSMFERLAPGLLAWLLALAAGGAAYLFSAPRMAGYAGVLAAAGAVASGTQANPGWPLLAGGTWIVIVGMAMLVRFVRRFPRMTAG